MSTIKWLGKQLAAKIEKAEMGAIDETCGSCVPLAKDRVHVKTRLLQGSIQFRPARREGNRIVGKWGSFDVVYALWQEVLPEPRGKPYLRVSADIEYPKLAARVRAWMKRGQNAS
jgi:hypothetical protein